MPCHGAYVGPWFVQGHRPRVPDQRRRTGLGVAGHSQCSQPGGAMDEQGSGIGQGERRRCSLIRGHAGSWSVRARCRQRRQGPAPGTTSGPTRTDDGRGSRPDERGVRPSSLIVVGLIRPTKTLMASVCSRWVTRSPATANDWVIAGSSVGQPVTAPVGPSVAAPLSAGRHRVG